MYDKAGWERRGQRWRDSGRGKKVTAAGQRPSQREVSALGPVIGIGIGHTVPGYWQLRQKIRLLLMAAPMLTWGQVWALQTSTLNHSAINSPVPQVSRSSSTNNNDNARKDLDSCHIHKVDSLPGSHQFASDFIETIVSDPDPGAKDPDVVWGLTADLSNKVPSRDRAMYISKSSNGGATWTQVARLDSRYFDAGIGEGLRNGLGVSPGGTDFVITTQRGAFHVLSQLNASDAVVKPIAGPRVPHRRPRVSIAKRAGDPVRANVVEIMADGKHMLVGYGYFDLDPQVFSYHKDDDGSWIEDGPLPRLPTEMDIFSMRFEDPKKLRPGSLYVGTGDQAYRLNFDTMKWTRIDGVGPDSAIHGMTTVGGLHLAACWGIYNPSSAGSVTRVTNARFLLHRAKDEVGPNLRAYSIEVDPSRANREVVTSITGVYTSEDSGQNWKRLNDLPDGEFRTAHFNADGTIIISGIAGTFLANPFSNACSPHLKIRDQ